MMDNIFGSKWDWQPSSNKLTKITTIDTTGGESLRIIVSGLPPIQGRTALQKSRHFMEHYDYIRTGLLLEPRGHANMYGAILTTSADPAVDLDCFFMTMDGYSTTCEHTILAIAKVVIESSVTKKEGPSQEITISVPAGLVRARAVLAENGEVKRSSFRNVPSFVYLHDQNIDVVGIGTVQFDLTFGAAFYAIVNAEALNLDLTPDTAGSSTMAERPRRSMNNIFKIFESLITRCG